MKKNKKNKKKHHYTTTHPQAKRPGLPRAPHPGARAPLQAASPGAPAPAPVAPSAPQVQAGAVARWARRFRRLAAVAAFAGEPPWDALARISSVRHGGIGIPRSAYRNVSEASQKRLMEKPFLVLDHPDEALARLGRISGPRAPAHLVDAAVHALGYGAPLVLLDRQDALALNPLVTHAVAIPGDTATQAVASELESILRGASAAVQDGYGQIDKTGQAILDLAHGIARERTLASLLMRLTRARKAWAARDAARRFRRIVDAQEMDSAQRGVGKGEADPLALTQPIILGYLDLLPLFMTRLGPTSDLLSVFEHPLAHLALGVGVVTLVEEREKRRPQTADDQGP